MKFKYPKFLKKKWFIFILIVIVFIIIYLFSQGKKKSENGYEEYQVTTTDLKQTITASGQITAKQSATLRFQTGGQLAWVGVEKGDYVQKWQAIASLDQRQVEKSLKKYLNTYLSTRFSFDNTVDQNDDNIANRNHLNIDTIDDQDQAIQLLLRQAQLGLDRTVLDVEISEISRQYAHLYSPIDGIVIEATDTNPGANISLATTRYVIVNPNSLRFSAQVEELDIGQIVEGMPAIINLDAFPDEETASSVTDIDFAATQSTSGNTVFIVNLPLLLNDSIRLDMNGDVDIIINEKTDVIAIPIDAVEEIDTSKFVQIKKSDGSLEKVEITTGIETDDDYEVLSGLNVGDIITIPE